jgi:Cu-Zn family superoxide dismutase
MVRHLKLSCSSVILCGTLAAGACLTEEPTGEQVGSSQQKVAAAAASTVMRDANGNAVATVLFTSVGTSTLVTVAARLPAGVDGVHGFHIHANDNPANGDGCIADPTQPANTHFVSADGHFNPTGATHGSHAGDMPPLFVALATGNTALSFLTDRFTVADIKGRAVILHAGADNFANIPLGAAANQYTANAADATTLTANTGNAGNRIACGVIQ